MKNLRKRLLSRAGETLIESLAAVLIFTLASVMFFSMVSVTSANNREIEQLQDRWAEEIEFAENPANADSTAAKTVTFTFVDSDSEISPIPVYVAQQGDFTAYYTAAGTGG